jgi:NADH-quinone oxidoreductase subunit I
MAQVDRRPKGHPHSLEKARGLSLGIGLLKGMAVTIRHLFSHNSVIQYPDERQDLSPRTRGVIALKEENCTVCMLCARECPDWCIYIDSHKETLPPKREGGRQRKRNVLDRFAIDYALCMYCGICVEVCPYDALFWSREFEYAEYDIRELTHEKERLSDWMATVLPPPPLEEGALLPGMPEPDLPAPSPPASPTVEATGAQPPTTTASAVEARPEQAAIAPKAPAAMEQETKATDVPEAPRLEAPEPAAPAATPEEPQAPTPNVTVPHEARRPVALERTEDPEQVYQQVLEEQIAKGSSRQVAEARAKVARVKAERGIKRGPTPVQVDKPVPSAPTKGQPAEPEASGAPEATEPKPEQGPVKPTKKED